MADLAERVRYAAGAAGAAGVLLLGGAVAGPDAAPGVGFEPPHDMTMVSELDGSRQPYVLLLPLAFDEERPADVMIAFHGHGSSRDQYVTANRGECKGARDVAARHGMIFVSPQYRGNSWMGPAAEADTVQLIRELRQNLKVGRIFLVGGSMGGTAVLTFTARHPELVHGVVSENGLANFDGYQPSFAGIDKAIQQSFGGTEAENPAEYRARSAEHYPEAFTMPIAFTTGGKDGIVPPASVRRLAEAVRARNPNVLVLHRPDGGHATSYEDTVLAIEFVVRAASGGDLSPGEDVEADADVGL